ncbi:MAG TPA: ribonuclease III [Actinomycetota bacterium]|nr:ribonuclease III [Actinomycetota bacterium]
MPPESGPLYELALTHRSYAFERNEETEHNERLEFLGDSILGAVVTDLIYRTYPDLAEGDMARLRAAVVNTSALADVARSLDVGRHLKLGKGEEASGGRDKSSLLANTFEALVGALYLDRGIEAVHAALAPIFSSLVSAIVSGGERYDVKTALQEVVVRSHSLFPSYRVASTGPDHDKRFTAHVYVDDVLFGEGSGRSKKEAEQNAAREALGRMRARKSNASGGGERGSDARAS